jgi:hypothetical protein
MTTEADDCDVVWCDMLQEERAREEERLRLEEERRILEEERRAREEAERRAIQRKNELDRKRSRLPSEPREGKPHLQHLRCPVCRCCCRRVVNVAADRVNGGRRGRVQRGGPPSRRLAPQPQIPHVRHDQSTLCTWPRSSSSFL